MARIDGPKYTGPTTFDFSDIQDDLVDLPPGGMKGARAEQKGIADVDKELAEGVSVHGSAVGITPEMYQRYLDETARLKKVRARQAEAAKILEVCTETRTMIENNREESIGAMARAVQDTARRSRAPGLMSPFEKLIRYNSQTAEKGARTRRKKGASKPAGEPPSGGGQTPPA